MSTTKKPGKSKYEKAKASEVFDEAEKAAMRERAKEARADARRAKTGASGEADLLAKVAEMPKSDRDIAERIHALVKATAPTLEPKTWYGMPAYAKDGRVILFFQAADKFKSRYATFGFNEDPRLDEGAMWATSWGLTKLTAAAEAQIVELVKKAAR